ncbi:hypothetical protein [Arthrobacter sp. AG1021]|uniref:hypothetical protein n=1 Tax=Arthrobacter sp. AG1021 TaxID=2183908 RepID=UPI0006B2587F|nr:hypothetical protein [Arthrobacter sp. AG1021]ALD63517.1 hypothetical protein AFL94_05755 [Arthrobacter sp. LS16]RKS19307.1 hypothetical protein DFO58_1789 [Arthrobacter sp. AG1021]
MARASRQLLRRCRTAAAAERGSAIVEFIFAATILLIPMIYLVLAAAALEGGSYAVVSAADQAAKVFAVSENPAQARSNAQAAADRAMANFGFSGSNTAIACSGECLSPGSVVTVTVSLDVPLPFVSDYISASAFTVDATAAQRVDRFG